MKFLGVLLLVAAVAAGPGGQTGLPTGNFPDICRCMPPGDQLTQYGYRCFYWASNAEMGTFRPAEAWNPEHDFGPGNFKINKDAQGNKYVTSGKWKCTSDILLEEDSTKCSTWTLPVGTNLVMNAPGTARPGAEVEWFCKPGYKLVGVDEYKCNSVGQWTDSTGAVMSKAPSCVKTSCPALPSPTNGQVSVAALTIGGKATYTCNAGFALVGPSSRECEPDGGWSDSAPTCNASPCQGKKPGDACTVGGTAGTCDLYSGVLDCTKPACHNKALGSPCQTSSGSSGQCTIVKGLDYQCIAGPCAGKTKYASCDDGNAKTSGDKCMIVGSTLVCKGQSCPASNKRAFVWKSRTRSTYFRVPRGCGSATVWLWGAGGGAASTAKGGAGGYISGTFPVAYGQVVRIYMGGPGANAAARVRNKYGYGRGGSNGGGTGGGGDYPGAWGGGGGGGYSRVTYKGKTMMVAGGGGGGALGGPASAKTTLPAAGGAGGGDAGQAGAGAGAGQGGVKYPGQSGSAAGKGGVNTKYSKCKGSNGRLLRGGRGQGGASRCTKKGLSPNGGGGGGGGGWGGGGGTVGGAGAGGSSWASATVTGVQNMAGNRGTPGNSGSADRSNYGGPGQAGRALIQLS